MKRILNIPEIVLVLSLINASPVMADYSDTLARNYVISSPVNNYFCLDGSFTGNISIDRDSVFFDMVAGSIKQALKYKEKGRIITVANIRLGVAASQSNGGWELSSVSNAMPVNIVIDQTTVTTLPSFHFSISRKKIHDLDGCWLAFSIGIAENGRINGFTYVHGSQNLFPSLPVQFNTWPQATSPAKNMLKKNYTIGSANNNPFGIDAKFTGDISMDDDSVYFNLNSGNLKQNLRFIEKGKDRLVAWITFNLSVNDSACWKIQEYGRMIKINKKLGLFDDIDIPPVRFAVSRKKISDLSKCWPTFTLGLRSDTGPVGTMYYHGKADVFPPKLTNIL